MSSIQEQSALEIVKHLADNGFQALYAGGYVRDMLMGRGDRGDIDIATSATPTVIASLFPQVIGVGEHFGVMVVVKNSIPFEVATFRSDIGVHDGRHPKSVAYTDDRSDALRRDFTINGMFFDPLTGSVLDYVNGKEDIERKIIKAIGEPALRFDEDYLRLMRAIRFAARLGFSIEPNTWQALKEKAEGILRISPERILKELDTMLTGNQPHQAVELLRQSGLLQYIVPEVAATEGVQQPPQFHPEGDVYTHMIKALSLLKNPSREAAWATFLHDIGKPATLTVSDRIRFSNHSRVGAEMARLILVRLKAPNSLIEAVYEIVDNHMNFMNVQNMRLSTLKRFLSRPTFEDEMEQHRVDCLASHGDVSNFDFLRSKQKEIPVNEIKPPPHLTGKDLISLGFTPGPLFKKILGEAYDAQLDGKITSPSEALRWVRLYYPEYSIL